MILGIASLLDMHNVFVFDGRHGWSPRKSMEVEGSNNVEILFIGTSRNSFFGGVFLLPIGNSTCSTTRVMSCSGRHTPLRHLL